jgi:hypothetical protein
MIYTLALGERAHTRASSEVAISQSTAQRPRASCLAPAGKLPMSHKYTDHAEYPHRMATQTQRVEGGDVTRVGTHQRGRPQQAPPQLPRPLRATRCTRQHHTAPPQCCNGGSHSEMPRPGSPPASRSRRHCQHARAYSSRQRRHRSAPAGNVPHARATPPQGQHYSRGPRAARAARTAEPRVPTRVRPPPPRSRAVRRARRGRRAGRTGAAPQRRRRRRSRLRAR